MTQLAYQVAGIESHGSWLRWKPKGLLRIQLGQPRGRLIYSTIQEMWAQVGLIGRDLETWVICEMQHKLQRTETTYDTSSQIPEEYGHR